MIAVQLAKLRRPISRTKRVDDDLSIRSRAVDSDAALPGLDLRMRRHRTGPFMLLHER